MNEPCTAEHIRITKKGDELRIGVSPQLVVNLKDQKNYIEAEGMKIPYKKEVHFSDDLLAGKRENVFQTAVRYYYRQACNVAEGMEAARKYKEKANFTVREIK